MAGMRHPVSMDIFPRKWLQSFGLARCVPGMAVSGPGQVQIRSPVPKQKTLKKIGDPANKWLLTADVEFIRGRSEVSKATPRALACFLGTPSWSSLRLDGLGRSFR